MTKLYFRVNKFDFINKIIQWEVKEFTWNTKQNRWVELQGNDKTLLFAQNNPFSTMTVINDTLIDTVTGSYALPNTVNPTIGECDFYIENLGKSIIFPAIQNGLQYKLGD